MTFFGAVIEMSGSKLVPEARAAMPSFTPGRIAPPRKQLSLSMTVIVVAVPRSMTMTGAP